MLTSHWILLYIYGYAVCFWVLVDTDYFKSLSGVLALFFGCAIWPLAFPGTLLRQYLRR